MQRALLRPCLILSTLAWDPAARADTDDDDREEVRETVPAVGDAAKADGPEIPPCPDGVVTATLTRRDDGLPDALLIPPDDPQATTWTLTGHAWFDGKILPLDLVVDGAPPWALGFPADVWFDERQARELTTLQLWLQPYDARGAALDPVVLEQLWLVWPDGPGAEPTLLDQFGREATAAEGVYTPKSAPAPQGGE